MKKKQSTRCESKMICRATSELEAQVQNELDPNGATSKAEAEGATPSIHTLLEKQKKEQYENTDPAD